MAGYRPRQGWIYLINPHKVSLRCTSGHKYDYDLNEPGELECKAISCTLQINSSRVFRGEHPHIIWTNDQFQDDCNYIQTFTLIPLTSKETYKGLPTVYPINRTIKNGLVQKSFALVHQICTVDANCFKDSAGNWLNRIGQLEPPDREGIEKRLKYLLKITENPSDDWFAKNTSPELLQKVFNYLPEDIKHSALEELINNLGSK